MSVAVAVRAMLTHAWRRYLRARRRWEALVDTRRKAAAGLRPVHILGTALTARVVESFDAVRAASDTLAEVRAALDEAGVDYVVLPRRVDGRTTIAVDDESRAHLLTALRRLGAGPEWAVVEGSGWRASVHPLATWAAAADARPARVAVFRALAAPSGPPVGDHAQAVNLDLWRVIPDNSEARVDGGTHLAGTRAARARNDSVAYLTPSAWESARQDSPESALRVPHLFDVTAPVDVVYTWVDGSDPEWVRRRDEALGRSTATQMHESATSASRFVTRDELRYSLRSLEMYASWVRTVHIVTDQQVPEWLDVDHPRVHLVDHREIFADDSVLPVFNSHAIESQLHRIPGLSEHYLYMNDDVFFGRPVGPELFFEANGLTRFFLSQMLLDVDPASARDMPVLAAAKNNRDLIEKTFGRTMTNKFQHTPHPQNRRVLEELEDRFPDAFATVSRSRFRHPSDISVASALHHYYAYAVGRAVPGTLRYAYADLSTVTSDRDLERMFEAPGHDVFCLNDTHQKPGAAADRAAEILRRFLERHYPLRSSFETDEPRP